MENNTVVGLILAELSDSLLNSMSPNDIKVEVCPKKSRVIIEIHKEDVDLLDSEHFSTNGVIACVNRCINNHVKMLTVHNKMIELILKN